MSYTIVQGEKTATWTTDTWIYYWDGFATKDWEDETTTNWNALGA
tara:strand:+ start:2461 stop:2595 length:135 start_codon:yes stop_codon:yes gene_type:complete